MEEKPIKYSTYSVGRMSIQMPIDPEIERFLGMRFSEKIESVLGVPTTAQTEFQTPLTLDTIRRAIAEVNKPAQYDYFAIHIDDILSVLRQLRKMGFEISRPRKRNIFTVTMDEFPYTQMTILIDVDRTMQRGKILAWNSYEFTKWARRKLW